METPEPGSMVISEDASGLCPALCRSQPISARGAKQRMAMQKGREQCCHGNGAAGPGAEKARKGKKGNKKIKKGIKPRIGVGRERLGRPGDSREPLGMGVGPSATLIYPTRTQWPLRIPIYPAGTPFLL